MPLEVLSAPSNPVVCHPGEDLELCWQLRFPTTLAAGAQLQLRESREVVGVIQDAVPAGCCVDLGMHLQAPQHLATCVQDFVLSSAGEILGDLSICLSIRTRAEAKELKTLCPEANPLGIIPGNHTRRIYFGKAQTNESVTSNDSIKPVEVVIERSHDEWELLDRPQLAPQLPQPLKERFGAPEEASLRFWVNGEEKVVTSGQFPVTTSLAEYLRYHLGLTGTKIGCGEGGCGACTVLLHAPADTMLLAPNPCMANACLRPLHSMNGWEVTTIEKVGTPKAPHPIQSAFVKHSASQCGMCTPGMVMSIYGHLAKGGSKDPQDLQGCIQGNLCRCTGYRPIHDAMRETLKVSCDVKVRLQPAVPLAMHRDGQTWFDCANLTDVFHVLSEYSTVPHRLVVGNTSTGVVKYYPFHRNDEPTVFINLQQVPELHEIKRGDGNALTLGAACTLSTLIEELEAFAKEHGQLTAVVKHLKLVAHPQVRDVGSWAGNVMIAKTHPDFPSDICLLLSTLNAKLTLMNAKRKTEVVDIISFLSDAKLPRNDEAQIIHSVTIPFPSPNSFLDTFKVMRRHMNTHAEVNAGFLFDFKDKDGVEITSARLVVGNIERKPFVAADTCKALIGKSLDSTTISAAMKTLAIELKAHLQEPSVPEPPFVVVDPQYRLNLAPQLFAKAALRARLARLGPSALSPAELSAAEETQRPASGGAQHFTVDQSTAPVGQPVTKFQGLDQACGTAHFVADLPLQPNTLFAVPVLADRVAMLQSIDASECLEVSGVHSFISAADVKEVGASNDLRTVYPGKIFADASEKTEHIGQFVGLVLAESFEAARAGARLVHIDYSETLEVTTTIDAALQKGYVQERHGPLIVGQKVTGPKTLQGKVVSAGQKHFYLETQTTYAYPDSTGGLIFNTACQTLDWAQTQMAKTLNMPKSKITVQNQRLGGAYGGKAMLFAPGCGACGVAVLKSNRPVLLQMDRTADFQAFGARAPFDASWELSHEDTGKIVSMKQEVLQNVGTDMLGFSQASSVNCYDIPHAQLHCKGVTTNLPVNTWMRAPGDFEGAFIMETIMEQVARAVSREPMEVQELNMVTGMQKAWQRLKAKVSYEETLKAVKDFNSKNRYRKKGIYCMGSRYQLQPHSFMEKCFVRVYDDGSVLLEHTGLEVGQGMDTKALQALTMGLRKIAADFSMDHIQLRIPKSTQDFSWKGVMGTFSSVTSETVVSAILDACDKLHKELQKFTAPGRSWTEVIQLAVKGGAQLSQAGVTDEAHVNNYSLFSAGCAQVEIDVLTGETQVNSFDLVYDCGKSLNPAVDIGQIEGSLIQALGFSLLEEESRGKDGRLINCGTWDYKVPSGRDIPVRLDVELLPCEKPDAPVLGSKASGEPAQLLGGAFFFAVKDAIGYAREEQGLSRNFRMDPPASPDRIQTACSTQL